MASKNAKTREVAVKSADIDVLLSELAENKVYIVNEGEVLSYVNDYPETTRYIIAVVPALRKRLGNDVEISLKLYKDPEIDDRYLTIYVREDPYRDDLLDIVDETAAPYINLLDSLKSWVLVTTDFRQPER